MRTRARTLKIVELAFAAWCILYICETLLTISHSGSSLPSELSGLTALVPADAMANVSHMMIAFTVLELFLVIAGGWILVLLLATGKEWAFKLFIPSCYLSMIGNVWTLAFPDEDVSRLFSRAVNVAYFALTVVMVRYARVLRYEKKEEVVSKEQLAFKP